MQCRHRDVNRIQKKSIPEQMRRAQRLRFEFALSPPKSNPSRISSSPSPAGNLQIENSLVLHSFFRYHDCHKHANFRNLLWDGVGRDSGSFLVKRSYFLLMPDPQKTIGRRRRGVRGVEDARGFLELVVRLRAGRPFIPKGLYRFKTFDESAKWSLKMMTRGLNPDRRQ